jgi:Type III restriction enzyme, res subunit
MKLMRRDERKGYVSDMLYVPKSLVNVEGVKNALEFELPERNSIRILQLWEESEHHLIVPRAFWNPRDLPIDWVDARPTSFTKTDVRSRVKLDHMLLQDGRVVPTGERSQSEAISALMSRQGGTLQIKCGGGKTVVALHFSALKQVPTIIVVDNTTLLLQWQKEIAKHLNVPGGVGIIQGDKRDWKKSVVMATYQTLANWAATMPEEVRRWFGLAIWDEGHHVSAPTFSKSAPLFYGYRLALTATPTRADGSHVICQHHVGDIIYKDVKQRNPPAIIFKWTGIKLDGADPKVMMAVNDKNGEIHIGKLAGYLGAHRERLYDHVLAEAKAKVASGHKALVLSYSVDEVINLMAMWTANSKDCPLYTDIPYPTAADVDETEPPVELSKSAINKAQGTISNLRANMRTTPNMTEKKKQQCREHIERYTLMLKRHEVWKKTESLYKKRQRAFLEDLLKKKSTAGLFTAAVDPDVRFKMLKERQVIFAIMKYGREGLDDKDLSAIIVSEPMSDQNILQQVMGRPRGKSNAVLVFFEDDIGPLIGQCKKLRSHLRNWDTSEGGPFKYELENHPAVGRRQLTSWTNPPTLRTPGSY